MRKCVRVWNVSPNAQCIEIHDLHFYYIWTNKCTKLNLHGHISENNNYNKDWCQFVIVQVLHI